MEKPVPEKIISSNIKDLHIIAKGLLEYETLTSSDIDLLLKGKKPKRPKEEDVKENLKENDDNKKKEIEEYRKTNWFSSGDAQRIYPNILI